MVDGGVYDNQGIQKLTQPGSSYECDIIITSDAGGQFRADKKYPNVLALLIRTVDLFMYRIKAFQMQQNIYRNVELAEKPIAYLSLGWSIENIIPGFINSMKKGQVLKQVIDAHNFDPEWIKNPETYSAEITKHLKKEIDYESVEKRNLTPDQLKIAQKVCTNLKCLSAHQTEYLIRHAENLTELQIKIYCPSLLPLS